MNDGGVPSWRVGCVWPQKYGNKMSYCAYLERGEEIGGGEAGQSGKRKSILTWCVRTEGSFDEHRTAFLPKIQK